jgi:hypothetical protein
MPIHVRAPDGSIAQFPDGTPDDTITKVMAREYGGPKVSTGEDVARASGSGLRSGLSGMADSVMQMGPAGLLDSTLKTLGMMDDAKRSIFDHNGRTPSVAPMYGGFSEAARRNVYAPQTAAGRTAFTAAEMAPNIFAPGNLKQKALNYAVPVLGSVFAGETARATGAGPQTEALARGGGAMFGAGAASLKPPNIFAAKQLPEGSFGRILSDIGVSTSIPQRMGKGAKGVEDLGKRAPIVGPAMSGYQDRQLGQLNRGVGLKALEPIGEGIPKHVKPGFEMVEYVDGRLSAQYDRAAEMVPRIVLDAPMLADAQRIGARRVDLAQSEQRLWDSSLKDKLTRLQSGEASGEMMKKIQSELRGLQAEQAKKGNTTLAGMYGELRQSLMGVIARANPQAAQLIRQTDAGWRRYSIMNDAAAAASAKGGVFLPGQLATQVRADARAQGSNMAGKGKGEMQDIATAASATIPDSYGNPGTANALLAGGAAGGVVGAIAHPATAVPVLAGGAALGAAATPYFLAGRKVMEQLPARPSAQEIDAAVKQLSMLAQKDPQVAQLRDQLLQRLGYVAAPTALAASAEAQPSR